MKRNEKMRMPTTKEAVFALLVVIGVILISINTALVLETALVLGAMTSAIIAVYFGYEFEEIENALIEGIKNGLGACMILMIIGMVVGTWILGGTIQTMVFYGLKLLSPQIFLPASFLLSTVTSLLIGSSFGTMATIGIVLMGVAEGLGAPAAMTAGAIVSGAIFGDKLSPMSDSTNLAAAMSGTGLFDHIRSMFYVSGPTAAISITLYAIIGKMYISGNVNLGTVEKILNTLQSNFNISLITLIPPLLMIILSVLKVPAIASLSASFATASIFAVFTQGANLSEIINVAANGYVAETGFKLIDNLLTQGGINGMMSTVAIILAGTAMGGVLEKTNVLKVLLKSLMNYVKTPKGLVLSTLASAYMMLIATGEMMVSMIIPGRTLEPAYKELNIHNSVLSRSLETAATLGCAILPWGVVSVYIQNVLDVNLGYIQYTFLPFISPIITIIYAFMGFALFKRDDKNLSQNSDITV
ncbi:Na+/H+ antiporter NhaC [Selenihalanaerobacter shriftii]|uniref:Transporter, NhaC family (TC 2.A.35) n=1 Tax=Selenihalanaerobacter shriftii TaxID=142842 RepID=A0A1T4QNT2_9FIRM|nr:Na+/H+ antiporter NhaC [Selenihalanaerobacter shriftii]SKA05345.1 transporter, NhaC family (TC 2.A.35) [Selenihalanaerobacter shriftii]